MTAEQLSVVLLTLWVMYWIERKIPNIGKLHTVSLCHALCTTYMSHHVLFMDPEKFFTIYDYDITSYPDYIQLFPYVSFGYAFYDMYYGISVRKIDYILHGIMFLTCTFVGDYYNVMHYSYVGLLMETSNIFLNFLPYDNLYINGIFFFLFILYRNIYFPIFTSVYVYRKYDTLISSEDNHERYIVLCALMINSLNFYWGRKIVRKAIRTMKTLQWIKND